MSAPEVFITSWGATTLPARFEERGVEPAAVLVRALEVHDAVRAPVAHTADAGKAREALGVLEGKGVRAARVEPHVEHVAHRLPALGIGNEPLEEALLG